MGKLELEFFYESKKRELLAKFEESKQRWEKAWAQASGFPDQEAELVYLKLDQQLIEKEMQAVLEELRRKVEAFDD